MRIHRIASSADINAALLILRDYSKAGQFERSFDYQQDDATTAARAAVLFANGSSDCSLHFLGFLSAAEAVAVGTVQLFGATGATWAVLENVVVARPARKRGHGSSFARALARKAFAMGAERVLASIYARRNPSVLAIARRLGMRERFAKLRWRANGEPAVVDTRQLTEVATKPLQTRNGINFHRYNCPHYVAVRAVIDRSDRVRFRPAIAQRAGIYIVESYVDRDDLPVEPGATLELLDRTIVDWSAHEFREKWP